MNVNIKANNSDTPQTEIHHVQQKYPIWTLL